MRLTETQALAVAHRGGNLLISASAGSGKTEVLARRVVDLLADAAKPCPIDAIAVVTFTRAAAAELRERVARMLRQRAADERDAHLRRHLHTAEAMIDVAQIGTIDSWCGRIVREHFAEAGVDPAYRVLGEQEAVLLRAQTLDALFEWVFTSDEGVAAAAREWLRALPQATDEPLRALVLQLSRLREQLLDPAASLARRRREFADDDAVRRAEAILRAGLLDEIEFQWQQLAELLADAPPIGVKLSAYCAALEEWREGLRANRPLAALLDRMEAWKAPRARRDQPEDPRAELVIERWWKSRLKRRWTGEPVRQALACAAVAARRAVTLIDLEAEYERRLREARQRLGALEFGDVLRQALDLLGEPQPDGSRRPTEVARRLQRRFQHILIDEYQDTSPVQVEVLRLLSRDAAGETNRFMVGDVKQSIYGFRKAEPALFTAQMIELDAGRAEGRALFLTDNFRSRAELLNPLNALFASLFDRILGGTDYQPRERLIARRADPPRAAESGTAVPDDTLLQVVLLDPEDSRHAPDDADETDETVDATDESDDTAVGDEPPEELERAEREAIFAAHEIRRLLDGGATVPIGAGERPAQLSDFAILLRSARQNAGRITATLRRHGVMAVSGGQEALLDTVEGRDVRALLALLCNRRQDLALAAWLRSPFVGLREPQLAELRAVAPRGPFHRAVLRYARRAPEGELRVALRRAFERLEDWRRASRELELPDLLRRMLRDSGYDLFVRGLRGGAHRAATLDALIELADRFAAAGQRGPAEFSEYLESLAAIDSEPSVGVAPQADAVRVMTIHASKGLEFPFTFLLCSGARFNRVVQRQSLFFDDAAGLGLRTHDRAVGGPISTAEHLRQSAAAWERHLSEELRLLYVAATRARERLWIVGHADRDAAAEQREAFRGKPIPRITRLAANSLLDWVLLGVGSAELDRPRDGNGAAVCVREWAPALSARNAGGAGLVEGAAERGGSDGHGGSEGRPAADPAAAEEWAQAACARITSGVVSTAATSPVALSVSAIKQLQRDAHEEAAALPAERDAELFRATALARPAFARQARAPDPRDVGLAVHRFFETCDLAALIRPAELERLVAGLVVAGRLAPDEAALLPIEDIRWFCGTPEAALLAAHADRCRREQPFVRALPVFGGRDSVLVRGIVDCVVETDAGAVILDYKTDRLPDAAALQRRFEEYCVQLQHYRAALQCAWNRPVVRTVLIFLAARQVLDVPPGDPPALELS